MNGNATSPDDRLDDDQLARQLAALDANAAAPADDTVRNLHAKLETLADDLRRPVPPDPHAEESALRRAVRLARDIGRDPSPETLASAAHEKNFSRSPLVEIGPYKLLARLGQGGMGTVYKALHTRLEKVVALKVLPTERIDSPESVARFQREMRAVGKLDHPHIVRAMDAGETDGTHYLVMEHVDGVDLSRLVELIGPLPISAACELVRQAALGLQAAHSRGMVHRDIKPANLMLARQEFGPPLVKVLDLGLALLSETRASMASGLTGDGHIMGTIDFMAPEQAGNSHTVDIRADIYSLGATLYALLTGGTLFHGREFKSLLHRLSVLATESAPPLADRRPDVPAELADIVHRMLARDPAERYGTPADVAAVLEPFAAGASLSALFDALPQAAGDNGNTVVLDTRQLSEPDSATASQGFSVNAAADPQTSPAPATQPRAMRSRRRTVYTACAAGLVGAAVLGAIVLSLRTPHGEVVVELADDVPQEMAQQLKIKVLGNGDVKVADAARGWSIDVKEGKYAVELAGASDHFQLDTNEVTVTRGTQEFVTVRLKPLGTPAVAALPNPWKPTPEQQAFFDEVAKLPAAQQIAAVGERLKTANPEFDGQVKHTIERERIVHVDLSNAPVREVWPLAALTSLKSLDITSTQVADLAPLSRLPALIALMCSATKITDLSPLQGMPLAMLGFARTGVADLTPLQGMPLTNLVCYETRISDLRPLAGMPLNILHCDVTDISDLSPLRGLPLVYLSCGTTRVTDLSPLQGMALLELYVARTRVSDLSPIRGMPLTKLNCGMTAVSDLSPLAGMPLREITVDIRLFHAADETLLRALPVQTIVRLFNPPLSTADYWQHVASRREAVEAFASKTAKLPAEEQIAAVKSRLQHQNPGHFNDMGHVIENGDVTGVSLILGDIAQNVTALRALTQLKQLTISGGSHWLDLSAVNSLPLEELNCTPDIALRNAPILRDLQTLRTINSRPAGEYLDSLTAPSSTTPPSTTPSSATPSSAAPSSAAPSVAPKGDQ